MQKECFKCHKIKDLSEFYRHPQMADGHVNKCKECNKRDVSENYNKNRDYYVGYDKSRLHDPKRVAARKEYAYSEHGRMVGAKCKKDWRCANHDKYFAHCVVNNAVRDRKLFKKPCEICGAIKTEAHHPDYTKPLDVQWLCRKHHLEIHGKMPYDFQITPERTGIRSQRVANAQIQYHL